MANEKRLIDADSLIKKWISERDFLLNRWGGYGALLNREKGRVDELSACIGDAENAPTVDAVEVVHGYWIDSYSVDHTGRITEHGIDCSVCDSVFKADRRDVVQHWKEQFKVCPFCGALMDGGNEDA